ncbi:MAG: barstar family protein [Deltaproteobacteria bacterium]|jgi:ribonuclease inhibitor|nr:barstar family protein [Deltaproteobacteria bacterium]
MPVRKKRCLLSGKKVRSLDVFYDEIARQLAFPEHFGRNLDALWDVLTADIEGPIELVWKNPDSSRLEMGPDFDRVLAVLKDAEKARKDFRLRLEK